MTKTQIEHVLGSYELPINQWITLEEVFPLIYLSQDANLYIDSSRERYRFRFDNGAELLEIAHGKTMSDGTFKSINNETSNYTPDEFISYDLIAGFCRTVYKGPYGTYLTKN